MSTAQNVISAPVSTVAPSSVTVPPARGLAPSARLARLAPAAARALLGLVFVVFGLNGFLHFLPLPPVPAPAGAFLGALAATGYMFPLIKGVEVVAGLLLLSRRFVPLSLALLAPVVVHIVAFHALLAPSGMALPLLVLGLEIYLAWSYRGAFRPMLRADAQPGA